MSLNNENLMNLINDINHISLAEDSLLECVLDYSKVFITQNQLQEKDFDIFFGFPSFNEQSCLSAREAIVLGMQAITLSSDVDFKFIIENCVNKEIEEYSLSLIDIEEKEKKIMIDFFVKLKKEIFSKVYSQNKELRRVTKLTQQLLDQRKETYFKYLD